MNLYQMRILHGLASGKTITAVARELHVTAPAISQQLAALRKEMGVPLSYRLGREVRLTEAGTALAEMAGTVQLLMESTTRVVQESGSDLGSRVRIAAFPSAGQSFFPRLTELATREEGGRDLAFVEHDVPRHEFAPLTDRYDLVVAHRMEHDEAWPETQLSITPLLSEPFDVALSSDHPLASRAELSSAELAGERWIAAHTGFPPDVALRAIEAAAGRPFHRAHRLNDYHTAAPLILGGELIALFPRFTAPRGVDGLVLRPVVDAQLARRVDVLARPHALARASVRRVLDDLVAIARRLSGVPARGNESCAAS